MAGKDLEERKLTSEEHWDVVWGRVVPKQATEGGPKSLIKRLVGKKLLEYRFNYFDYLVWEVIFPRVLPRTEGLKVVEVGSAPGTILVRFNKEFGYEPYGIEYSNEGVEANRRVFADNGINPENVIHADLFSPDCMQYNNSFDVVISWSFVEHFSDSEDVIKRHVDLVKDDGFLIIIVPNLRGLNYLLMKLLRPGWKQIHQFGIMDKNRLRSIAENAGVSTLHCAYIGIFNLGAIEIAPTCPLHFLTKVARTLQLGVNIFYRLVFPKKGPEHRYLSPYLVYVGQKKALQSRSSDRKG